jgi:hypothetical protein
MPMKTTLMIGAAFLIGIVTGLLLDRSAFREEKDKDLEFALTYAKNMGWEIYAGAQLPYVLIRDQKIQLAEQQSKHTYVMALILNDLCLTKIEENKEAIKAGDLKWFTNQKKSINRSYKSFAESGASSPFTDDAILRKVTDHPLIKGDFPIGKYFKKRLEESQTLSSE